MEALARNPQALKQTLGSAWKSFFKGAVKENLEEMPDELFSQISETLAVNPGADLTGILSNFIKNLPELMIAVSLLGGAGDFKKTLNENRQIRNSQATPPTAAQSTAAQSTAAQSTAAQSTAAQSTAAQSTAPSRTPAETHAAFVHQVGSADHPTARKVHAGRRALEVMPPDQRAIFEQALDLDAARHAAGIPSALEYHRRLGAPLDPAVAAAHRWLDSFRPADAPLQWRRMMAASDRGKNIATVLQSELGLGAQTAPHTAIPGAHMPVYSTDRSAYRPPPHVARDSAPEMGRSPADARTGMNASATRPSLFGPLEARRAWAVAKVRELESIAADPNRSQPDRTSAKRGARQITRDIANYQGLNFTQAEMDAEANPLLTRMDGWGGGRQISGEQTARAGGTTDSRNEDIAAIPLPHPQPKVPTWVGAAIADYWTQRYKKLSVKHPLDASEIIGELPANTGPLSRLQILQGLQSFLDLLPADIARAAGRFELRVEPVIRDKFGNIIDAHGVWVEGRWRKERVNGLDEWVYDPPHITISHAAAQNEATLRGVIWHEMAHWLWFNADKHPRITQWRNALEDHFVDRTAQDTPEDGPGGKWKFLRDEWITPYAGRVYPGESPGVEIPSVYLDWISRGPSGPARWDASQKGARSTFELCMLIFGD